jgi:hypothetical protein
MASPDAAGVPGSSAPGRPPPSVLAVSAAAEHAFSKEVRPRIHLLEGLGVQGDAHLGRTVQHLSRMRRDPTVANLRQVHLVPAELFAELRTAGHEVAPGQLGENVTTVGVDLLALPVGTVLHLGDEAEVQLTGLRNPCRQIDAFQPGLLKRVLGRHADGSLERRAGVMAVVRRGGDVVPGDPVRVVLPDGPHRAMQQV